jgi:predicted Zn finger-like uncharacterized protein
MKITCQACQSKYTIADDKIQGKVAKIRCRKCGATVLVDASVAGGRGNGSGAPPATSDVWLVSVAEGDQRSMQLAEVIDAYNSGAIVADTYLWKEGMGDWQPLSEIGEIVNALTEANAAAAPQEEYQAPAPAAYAPPAAYTPPTAYTPPVAHSPAPAVAARRETARGRGDLFGGGVVEEEVATSAPAAARGGGALLGAMSGGASVDTSAQRSGLTGARDEHSVLFSLTALTSGAKAPSAPPAPMPSSSSRNEDSGLIDLNALAKAQQTAKAAEEVAPLAAPTPFLFPAALGTVETFQPSTPPQKKSSMPLIIGGGLAVAGIAIAIAIFAGGKKEEAPPPAAATASAAVEPTPPPPVASAEAAPADSAPAVASAKAAPKKPGGGGARAVKPGPAAVAATPLPTAPPKPRSPCGCAASDLQCQIRCSAVGH